MMLRILVDSGRRHGYQIKLEITYSIEKDDIIFVQDDVKVVDDSTSLQFIRDSTVDFAEEYIGFTFQIVNNPNAKNSGGFNISYDIDHSQQAHAKLILSLMTLYMHFRY